MCRLICAFVVHIWHKTHFLMAQLSYKFWTMRFYYLDIWAMTWQNQQSNCAPSEDSDQPGHPPSLISVFAVHMKKAWVLSYPLSAQRRLWSGWADAQADLSLRWAHTHFVGFIMLWLICGKGTEGMAFSADPDQTAPSNSKGNISTWP